ncbi:ComF family protein [Cellvibrio japonicus]|uniref:Competence protein ComF n=1 Tax=Cellvibrio japonicus (strain Ueda107) TaxID=498211 RepID=B3PI86_CELJU|nr:ComF family protein [Cellvibrio japonicus]ACE85579.1 competence protein ComF [Cellvibrio japonicus Ueda107]
MTTSPWLTRLLDHLLPCPCLLCDGDLDTTTDTTLLCQTCVQSLPLLDSYRCHCCSLPLASTAYFCGQCLAEPASFTASIIPYRYAYPLDALIHRFKYQQQPSAGRCLGKLLLQHIRQRLETDPRLRPDLLVPVPLHWRRRWQRGFNQASLLSRQLGQALGIAVLPICTRLQHTHSQKGLNRQERLRNLRRAFAQEPKRCPAIQGKHLALVDDVVTTSATARCLSELLVRAGAARVDIWALARTPAPGESNGL